MNKKSYDIRRIAVLFIAVTIIISGLFFLRGGITGQAIFSEEENYTQRLDLEINNKSEYLWVLDNPGNLRSVKLSGLIEQKASAKVYLEHNNEKYLIFDSDELGEEELSKITGFVVSNKSNKQKNNDSDKNVSKDKKDKKSESNETTEEERINETSEEVIDETVEEEIINKTITIDLKYKSGSVYDTNDDGIETLTGVVDLTVENTEFNWDADEENICTRWNVYSIEDEESTSVCYGSQKCCNFVDLSAARPDWNELFYSAYGQYGSTSNNVISAQVLYVDYNLSVDDPFAEIHYSEWSDLNADYYDLISSFENICIDTCLLEGFNESEYRLIFEVDDGVLNIDTITYMVEEERNETKIDLEITPKITSKKKHFKFDEDIELDFEYLTETELISQGKSLEKSAKPKQTKKWVEDKETIETSVYDSSGRLTSIEPEIKELREGKFNIKLPKQRAFRTGKYTIKLELIKDGITYTQEQDFTWGVLAINVNKSIYLPNENSFIGIAILGDAGHMVCDADVTLEIIDPLNNKEILSTENGLISISPECEVYGVTNLPDYHTSYSVSGVGNYVMNLTAVTFNGVKSILDNFTVQSSVDFDVARHGPTRIYPLVPYYMNISIIANKNYNGVINEYVPASFDITQQDGLTVTTIGDSKVLSWNKNLVGGETYNLYYEFDAPDISPEFYLLGALEIGSFAETRNWMIASDTIDILFEGFETGSFADNGWTASGGTLNWVVDDGTESANYDGSLYHAHAENVDLMTVLETSISTFGYENVEFTFYAYTAGLDAGPPLEYISAEWSDGTDWTQILAPTQVIASYTKYGGSLAASADNNPDFKIRFNCTSGGPNELCAVDNVNISGTAVPDLT
ncbi:MAG: hypothetical protein ABIG89_02960, partial [Candidatus Woesearchaeota archaeon]